MILCNIFVSIRRVCPSCSPCLLLFPENFGYYKLRHEIFLRIVLYARVNINHIKMFIAFINFTNLLTEPFFHDFGRLGFSWLSLVHSFIQIDHVPYQGRYSINEGHSSLILSMICMVYLYPDNQIRRLGCNVLSSLHFSLHVHTI